MIDYDIGRTFERLVGWLGENFDILFDGIKLSIEKLIELVGIVLGFFPPILFIIVVGLLALWISGKNLTFFVIIGLFLINYMGLWEDMIITLAMVLSSTFVAVLIGIPVGVWSARNNLVEGIVKPILDLMQTMPAYVYLIPAVLFFNLGMVPGAIATIIFSIPPSVRLTNLGIRQVDKEVVEASEAFGSTKNQLLFKVQLPLALPTILAGLNQTIMLALSMVVISAMIGARGLGLQVYNGITQLRIGQGFESGLAIVILAIVLDRLTQSLARRDLQSV